MHRNHGWMQPLVLGGLVGILGIALISGSVRAQQFRWTRHTINGGGGQPGIAVDPNNGNIAYATGDLGGIIKTTDGGSTWFSINNNIGNRKLSDVEIDPLNSQVVYVTAVVQAASSKWNDDPPNGELYRTLNGGQSWEVVYGEGVNGGASFSINNWPSCRNVSFPYDSTNPSRYDADGDRITDVIVVGGWVRIQGGKTNPVDRSGIWKSTDEGKTFRQITLDNRNIYVVKFDPNNPDVVYAGTSGDGLYRSRDCGKTWQKIGLGSLKVTDIAMVPHKSIIYVATDGAGVYKSTDGGVSFSSINSNIMYKKLSCMVIIVDRMDLSGNTVYAGFWRYSNAFYKTTDGGTKWTKCNPERPSSPNWFRKGFDAMWALAQGGDGALYATTWRGIYRYDRTRDKWLVKSTGLGNILVNDIVVDPDNTSTAYLAIYDSRPWKTSDGGKSWEYIGTGFKTSDGGNINGVTSYAISPARPQTIYATGGQYMRHGSAVCKTTNGGRTWKPICNGLPPTNSSKPQWQAKGVVVSPTDPDLAFVTLNLKSGGGAIYRTSDGGRNWSLVKATSTLYAKPAISRTDEVIVTAGASGRVYIGVNAGTKWITRQLPTKTSIWAVDICPSNPNRILVGTNIAGVYLTTNRGASWRRILGKTDLKPLMDNMALSSFARARYPATIWAVKFDPRDLDTVYVGHSPSVYAGVGILRSLDFGKTWAQLTDPSTCLGSIRSIAVDERSGNILAGGFELCMGSSLKHD